jgi:hypothetical protein
MMRLGNQERTLSQTTDDPVIDASYLAAKFGLSPDSLKRLLQRGLVRSRVETGVDEDEGTKRLTIRVGNRQWVAVMDAREQILSEEMRFVGRR